MEQKTWITTWSPIYPNLYVFLVGRPGVGKSRTIGQGRKLLEELSDLHVAPISMTMASLVDCLMTAKRIVPSVEGEQTFNSMVLMPDEWAAFMHKWDDELMAGLTTFYDVDIPYSQHRRGKEIKIKIKSPQLSILAGTTPSSLLKFMPEGAWEQGFCSRIIMVYSDERKISDDAFGTKAPPIPDGMLHDIRYIHNLSGEFSPQPDFVEAVNNWRKLGQPPTQKHPKLLHYNTRRFAHLLKLCMVASADRSNLMQLTITDFNRAMGWLLEAELAMPLIFEAGSLSEDSKIMEEIAHFVQVQCEKYKDRGVSEGLIIRFASTKTNAQYVLRILDIMERSGQLKVYAHDQRTGMRTYITPKAEF